MLLGNIVPVYAINVPDMKEQIEQEKEELKAIDKNIIELQMQIKTLEVNSAENKAYNEQLITSLKNVALIEVPFLSVLKANEKSIADIQSVANELKNYEENFIETVTTQLKEELAEAQEESTKLKIKIAEDELELEKLIENLPKFEGVTLQYSASYNITSNKMTPTKGVVYFNGHKETYYSQKVLPGGGLNIPGRHVADDGTIRDGEGYIVVASDLSFLPRYSLVMTSLGPGKVYDTGCAYGVIDIYVNW